MISTTFANYMQAIKMPVHGNFKFSGLCTLPSPVVLQSSPVSAAELAYSSSPSDDTARTAARNWSFAARSMDYRGSEGASGKIFDGSLHVALGESISRAIWFAWQVSTPLYGLLSELYLDMFSLIEPRYEYIFASAYAMFLHHDAEPSVNKMDREILRELLRLPGHKKKNPFFEEHGKVPNNSFKHEDTTGLHDTVINTLRRVAERRPEIDHLVMSMRKRNKDFNVRIDRESMWGNPYQNKDPLLVKLAVETGFHPRDVSVALYSMRLMRAPTLARLARGLANKRLGCWCSPKLCHGHVLALAALKGGR